MRALTPRGLLAVVLFLTVHSAEVIAATSYLDPVLALVEEYKAPPYPQGPFDREAYDYRIRAQRPVPTTLTVVFVCDLWLLMSSDLQLRGISMTRVSESDVKQALDIYMTRDWRKIPGLRPWTHWNFVRSLSPFQRLALATEVSVYMADNGSQMQCHFG